MSKCILPHNDKEYKQDMHMAYQRGREDTINELLTEIKRSDRYKYFSENNELKLLRFEEDIEQITKRLRGEIMEDNIREIIINALEDKGYYTELVDDVIYVDDEDVDMNVRIEISVGN